MEKEMKNEEIKRKAKEWFASYTANSEDCIKGGAYLSCGRIV